MKGIRNLFTYRIRVIKLARKELQSTKSYAILLVLVMLVGIFSLSPAISSSINNVIIRNAGRIVTATAAPIAYKSEIRGVFVHCASWSGPIDWDLIAETCANYGIDAIYGEFLTCCSTYYDSEFLDEESAYGDQIGKAINACHPLGIEVYPAMDCMTASKSRLEKHGVNAEKSDGSNISWACPIKLKETGIMQGIVEELVTLYDIDGFMFDYMRYSDATTDLCYCSECRAAFQEWLGEVVSNWTDFYPSGARWEEYADWRNIPVNELVRDMRNWMLAIKPDLEITHAAWTCFSDCPTYWRKYLGQDTGNWIKNDYLDSVAPMIYTSDADALGRMAEDNMQYWTDGPEGKIPLYAFITTGISSPYDPADFVALVDKCREVGVDGWIIWRYGGPGVNPSIAPDIRDYLSIIDMPDVFALRNIEVSPSDTQATITWITELPATSKVEYSQSPLFTASWTTWQGFPYWDVNHVAGTLMQNNATVTDHSITLTDLLPETKYYFRVQSEGSGGTATSKVLTFTTES